MNIASPHYQCLAARKNGSIHNGKQKYQCLSCLRQFVENPQNKVILSETREKIGRLLLERVSLESICRLFDVSMPWLLEFMQQTFLQLPDDLNATVLEESSEFEVVVLEADEMWSFVGKKQNDRGYGLSCIPRQDRFWHSMLASAIKSRVRH